MLLPAIQSLRDCGSFLLTVRPFVPQLSALPARLAAVRSLAGLAALHAATNPLVAALAAALLLACVFVVVSEANRNYSQVDRMWSVLPSLYLVHLAAWARLAGVPHSRIDLVAASTALWSMRLTFNYWRRGGYSVGSEDYRWQIVKANFSPLGFFVFNVLFISFFQSFLLFSLSCVPAYTILLASRIEPSITTADVVYSSIIVALVVVEYISDGQQWAYQEAKRRYLKDARVPPGWDRADLDRGFVTSGLWAYSRHPNFLAEQTVWLVLYHWSCYATDSLYNYTLVGAALLVLLFRRSTALTETITSAKYPAYADYQKQVGIFLPTSLRGYRPSSSSPKVIKMSDLAKRQQQKDDSRKQK